MTSIKIFEDEIFAVIHRENKLNSIKYLEASHFSDMHLLINSFPLECVSVYQHFLKPNRINPIKLLAIPFTEITLSMIEANMGIMCSPKWQLNSFKLSEDIILSALVKMD